MAAKRNSYLFWEALNAQEKKEFERSLKLQSTRKNSQELNALRALKEKPQDTADRSLAKAFGISLKNDGYLRTLHSRLSKKLKQYLMQLAYRNRHVDAADLLREINKRNVPQLFEREYKKARKDLEATQPRTAEYYKHLYYLEAEWQRYLVTHKPKDKKIPFSKANEVFDLWWVHGKLSHACIALSHAKIRKKTAEDPLLPYVLHLIEHHAAFQAIPLLQFYLKFYQFLQDDSALGLDEIQEGIQRNFLLLDSDEQHNFCTLLINYYLRSLRENSGKVSPRKVLDFYVWSIEQKAILKGADLPWDHYRNLIGTCLSYTDLGEARIYLKKYKKLLPEASREDFYGYFQGRIYFQEKRYKMARRKFLHTYAHPMIDLPARIYYVQACYEDDFLTREEWIKQLEQLEEAIRHDTHAAFARIRAYYLYKVIFFRQLLQCSRQSEYKALLKEMGKQTQVADKDWLIQAIRREQGV